MIINQDSLLQLGIIVLQPTDFCHVWLLNHKYSNSYMVAINLTTQMCPIGKVVHFSSLSLSLAFLIPSTIGIGNESSHPHILPISLCQKATGKFSDMRCSECQFCDTDANSC